MYALWLEPLRDRGARGAHSNRRGYWPVRSRRALSGGHVNTQRPEAWVALRSPTVRPPMGLWLQQATRVSPPANAPRTSPPLHQRSAASLGSGVRSMRGQGSHAVRTAPVRFLAKGSSHLLGCSASCRLLCGEPTYALEATRARCYRFQGGAV